MRKILWLVNAELPQIAKACGHKGSNSCGWIAGAYPFINENYQLTVLYPVFKKQNEKRQLDGNARFIAFYQNGVDKNSKQMQDLFIEILETIKPDIIDIWGTEFIRSFNMFRACIKAGYLDRLVVSLQGLSSEIAAHYSSNLNSQQIRSRSFRDVLRRDSIGIQRQRYAFRAKYENILLENIKYCIGKTDWDEAVFRKCNQSAQYFRCYEILRDEFYNCNKHWNLLKCKRHTIVLSQGNYPLKGLHIVLEALLMLRNQYPDIELMVAGTSPVPSGRLSNRIKITSYGKIIKKIIRDNELEKNVCFTGVLNASQMIDLYLEANAVVVSSSIENESNSISEALYLGVPIVTSFVGGITSRVSNGVNGYCYPYDEPYMLAFYLNKLFSDDSLCKKLSYNGNNFISELSDKKSSDKKRAQIYQTIINNSELGDKGVS